MRPQRMATSISPWALWRPLERQEVERVGHQVAKERGLTYRRGSALKKRRQLMEAWARYVGGASTVVTFASRVPQLDDRGLPPRQTGEPALGVARLPDGAANPDFDRSGGIDHRPERHTLVICVALSRTIQRLIKYCAVDPKKIHPPTLAPEIFERPLPYAIMRAGASGKRIDLDCRNGQTLARSSFVSRKVREIRSTWEVQRRRAAITFEAQRANYPLLRATRLHDR
jgi:hypothetical protein